MKQKKIKKTYRLRDVTIQRIKNLKNFYYEEGELIISDSSIIDMAVAVYEKELLLKIERVDVNGIQ